jgi:hypothetical protein
MSENGGKFFGPRLPFQDREPSIQAIADPSSAAFQLMLAQHQRDHGNISDRAMAKVEGHATILASRARLLWNPFTGEFRTKELSDLYRSGDYLRIDERDGSTKLVHGSE